MLYRYPQHKNSDNPQQEKKLDTSILSKEITRSTLT